MGRMPADEIRARGLAGAAACFRDRGVANTSVDDIVRASGVARSTLYRHLGDRDDLLLAVVLGEVDQLRDELSVELSGAASAIDILVEGVVHAIDFVRGSTVLHELVVNPGLLRPAVRDRALASLADRLAGFVDLVAVREETLRRELDLEIAVEHLVRTITSLAREDAFSRRSGADRRSYLRATLVPVFVPDSVVRTAGGTSSTI